jgi:hypothetical protein
MQIGQAGQLRGHGPCRDSDVGPPGPASEADQVGGLAVEQDREHEDQGVVPEIDEPQDALRPAALTLTFGEPAHSCRRVEPARRRGS